VPGYYRDRNDGGPVYTEVGGGEPVYTEVGEGAPTAQVPSSPATNGQTPQYAYSTPGGTDTPRNTSAPARPNYYVSQRTTGTEAKDPYSTPSAAPAASTSPPASAPTPSAVPTDEEIDAMLAANGGRISSRGMRGLEKKVRTKSGASSSLRPPPGIETEAKRKKATANIVTTKNTDSEGGDLKFVNDEGSGWRKNTKGWSKNPEKPAAAEERKDGGLASKKLVSHYEGENTHRAWRAGKRENAAKRWNMDPNSTEFEERWQKHLNSDETTTHYDTPAEREKSRLKEGPDGTVRTTHDRRPGGETDTYFGWVMDPDSGNVHTFDPAYTREADGKTQYTHHSSPLAGGNVAGAGLMKAKDGHITKVTDESGHYRPEAEYTYQAVNAMAERGLLTRDATEDDLFKHDDPGPGKLSAKVTLAGKGHEGRPGKGWLEDEKDIYQGDLTLPYQAFLQTKGNERQARAKKKAQDTLTDELKAKGKKVKEDPGSKKVRKDLKAKRRASEVAAPRAAQSGPQAEAEPAPSVGTYIAYKDAVPPSSAPTSNYVYDTDGAEAKEPTTTSSGWSLSDSDTVYDDPYHRRY